MSAEQICEEIECVLHRNMGNEKLLRKILTRALILEELLQKEATA